MNIDINTLINWLDENTRSKGDNNSIKYMSNLKYKDCTECKPCNGCNKVIPGKNLLSHGYHYDCIPCKQCNKTIKGVGLLDNGYHYECYYVSI